MTTQPNDALEFTGERFIPEESGQIAFEHLHRYYFARKLVGGKDVLDVACGEGYGSDILARVAKSVVGVDIASQAVAHAKARYVRENLGFVEGSAAALPFEDHKFDVVVSFETIEHHDRHEEMMLEISRVLRPGGVLVISSPDKQHYSIATGCNNPFHVKELFLEEFLELVRRHFDNATLFGQRVVHGSLMVRSGSDGIPAPFENIRLDRQTVEEHPALARPLYDILLAGNGELPTLANSLFETTVHDMDPAGFYGVHLPERVGTADRKILALEADLATAESKALSADKVVAHLEALDEKLGGADAKLARLQEGREVELSLVAEVRRLGASLEDAEARLASSAHRLAETTASQMQLEAEVQEIRARLHAGDAVLADTRERLRARERELAELLGSRSWRFTAWLRAMSGWLRRQA